MQVKKEIKSFQFELKATSEQDNNFIFEGYASIFNNVDYGNDTILKGAFEKSLNINSSVPILWQHDMREPIGISAVLKEDKKGLFVQAKLPKDDSYVSGRVIPQMRIGSIKEMSIGFFTKDSEIQKGIRVIKEIDLFEISLVTKAMNPEALVTNFKSFSANSKLPLAPRNMQWDSTEAEKRIRDFTNSNDIPSADYKKYFMYYDGDAPELFGSYKLLFADVVDGEIMIVPRAIFAIAGILNGARGGVDITENDKNKIKPVINQLYKRMADEFNDDTITSPLIKSMESLSDIEKTLKESGFSNNEAKTLISKVKEFSNQRDVEEQKAMRDAEQKAKLIAEINNLTNLIKSINKK